MKTTPLKLARGQHRNLLLKHSPRLLMSRDRSASTCQQNSLFGRFVLDWEMLVKQADSTLSLRLTPAQLWNCRISRTTKALQKVAGKLWTIFSPAAQLTALLLGSSLVRVANPAPVQRPLPVRVSSPSHPASRHRMFQPKL